MTAAVFTTAPKVVVDRWTGAQAAALRVAVRATNESFAHRLGTAVRTVAKWNASPHLVPMLELQRALDTALAQASAEAQQRFLLLSQQSTTPGPVR